MNESIEELDKKAESIIRWGAARGGVVVVVPAIGVAALFVNEIYMIMRMGTVYGEDLSASGIKGFLLSLGGAFAGQSLSAMIPFPPMQIPIAVSVTYGVGKAAQAWIKDGMPADTSKYKEEAKRAQKYAKEHVDEIKNDQRKDTPLGEESKEF